MLAFIDAWTYEITFDSLTSLAQGSSTDLLVTFHTGAIKRNAQRELKSVELFLGEPSWRSRYFAALGDPSNPPTHILLETFQNNLRDRLGFSYFGNPVVFRNTTSTPMYYLLFASHNPRGLDFWEKSRTIMPSGQRTML